MDGWMDGWMDGCKIFIEKGIALHQFTTSNQHLHYLGMKKRDGEKKGHKERERERERTKVVEQKAS